MKPGISVSILLIFIVQLVAAQQLTNSRSAQGNYIIPMPYKVDIKGNTIKLGNPVYISAGSAEEKNAASFLTTFLKSRNTITQIKGSAEAAIVFTTLNPENQELGKEGYIITTSDNKISISANTGAGLFYGVQTLIQMLPADVKAPLEMHGCDITDKPAFAWRGTMLDPARHMISLDYIKKHIDRMAMYKLNTLHLHLTDDQGWRIEIKKYPRLTEISSKRKETLIGWQGQYKNVSDFKFDGKVHSGYYTQDELRELVAYAAARHITIVPEIEMPGHSVCVLAAYPTLACNPGKFEVATYWGVFDDIICPTPAAIEFYETVLDEVCDIFPGTYIHIGGDEAPKTRWKESDYVKELMKREGFDDVEKVQGWFNRQIESYLKSKNRKLIGWDEILEGGISASAGVMSWRGEEGGIKAANMGNEVVMSPGSKGMYWDHAYGNIAYEPDSIGRREGNATFSKIYAYNPIPKDIAPDKKKYILGVQANLWSEYIRSPYAHEYLTFPRILALSEIGWTDIDNKNWYDFLQRTAPQYVRFDEAKINYRLPEPELAQEVKLTSRKYEIKLYSPIKGAIIRYTTDGTTPTINSDLYLYPIKIKKKLISEKKIMAITITPDGKISAPALIYTKIKKAEQ